MNVSSSSSGAEPEESFVVASVIFTAGLLGAVLICIFVSSSRFFNKWMHESLAILALGTIVGALQYFFVHKGVFITENLFKPGSFSTIFYALLFPPVIFNAGFTLKKKNFMSNIGSILTYAFLGTAMSAFGMGGILYAAGKYLHVGSTDVVECIIFGALMASTDTVATMAVLAEINVVPVLFALVFGESVLNDAVAIALCDALAEYVGSPLTWLTIGHVALNFLIIILGSAAIGIVGGLAASFLAAREIKLELSPTYQIVQILMWAYLSYVVAELLDFSGVIALFVCAILESHYSWHSISTDSRKALFTIAGTLDFLSEVLVFFSLGILLFTKENFTPKSWSVAFIAITLAAMLLTRFFSVFFLSAFLNIGRKHKILYKYQLVLSWCGMRGIVTLLLALNLKTPHKSLFVNTVYVVVFFTNVVIGIATRPVVACLNVRSNVEHVNVQNPEESMLLPPFEAVRKERSIFARAWFLFDNKVMKKAFGGRPRVARATMFKGDEEQTRSESCITAPLMPSGPIDDVIDQHNKADRRSRLMRRPTIGPMGDSVRTMNYETETWHVRTTLPGEADQQPPQIARDAMDENVVPDIEDDYPGDGFRANPSGGQGDDGEMYEPPKVAKSASPEASMKPTKTPSTSSSHL